MPSNDSAEFYEYFNAVLTDGCGDAYKQGMDWDMRQNAVLSKEGMITHRNADWWDPSGRSMYVVDTKHADHFQVDFTFSIIKRIDRDGQNKASFKVNYRTSVNGGMWSEWNGSHTGIYVQGDATDISIGSWGGEENQKDAADKPSATPGAIIHVRLTHTVSDGRAQFKWQWSNDGTDYHDWYSYDVATSTADGNMGSPIGSITFQHEYGMIRLGGARVTILN